MDRIGASAVTGGSAAVSSIWNSKGTLREQNDDLGSPCGCSVLRQPRKLFLCWAGFGRPKNSPFSWVRVRKVGRARFDVPIRSVTDGDRLRLFRTGSGIVAFCLVVFVCSFARVDLARPLFCCLKWLYFQFCLVRGDSVTHRELPAIVCELPL